MSPADAAAPAGSAGAAAVEPPPARLVKVFRADVLVGDVEDHGVTSRGHRRVVPILGGRLGDGVDAEVLPGGADWQVVRSDGTIEIDTRYTARTAGGELLHVRTHGLRSGEPDVLAALGRGEAVPSDRYAFRLHVEVETSAPAFAALQRRFIIGVAARGPDRVVYDAYAVD
ncbi:DUF3237 domain-containing protein [Agromyces salentinus]|uniref:DUF3237 domain-containing protein n=1 Tax=Agromyces salentinus TaxID=269421 RepID=A0ABN2MEW3_9MICO|nr:DUF3237 domain-containing protein [Agromyces salentinus]